jgi:hypothetical protein
VLLKPLPQPAKRIAQRGSEHKQYHRCQYDRPSERVLDAAVSVLRVLGGRHGTAMGAMIDL